MSASMAAEPTITATMPIASPISATSINTAPVTIAAVAISTTILIGWIVRGGPRFCGPEVHPSVQPDVEIERLPPKG